MILLNIWLICGILTVLLAWFVIHHTPLIREDVATQEVLGHPLGFLFVMGGVFIFGFILLPVSIIEIIWKA